MGFKVRPMSFRAKRSKSSVEKWKRLSRLSKSSWRTFELNENSDFITSASYVANSTRFRR